MIENKIDKYLNETKDPYDTIDGHINGAIRWLEDIRKMTKYSEMPTINPMAKKMALQTYKNLMKNLKALEKFLK